MKSEVTQQTRNTRRPVTAAIAGLSLAALALTGCGSDDESESTTAATAVMAEDSSADTTAAGSTDTTPAGSTDTEASAEGTATTTAGGDAETAASGSEAMTADGNAKMEISPDWTDVTAATGITSWQVGEIVNGFGPNVNLIGQPAPGMSLDQYIDTTKQQLEAANMTVVDSGTVTGSNGQELGYFEYTGDAGQGGLHFLGYVNIADDKAALATLTAPDPTFGEIVDQIRPFLETVQTA